MTSQPETPAEAPVIGCGQFEMPDEEALEWARTRPRPVVAGTPAVSLPPIPDEAVRAACEAADWSWHPEPGVPSPEECMAPILAAAAPYIARATLERTADRINGWRLHSGEDTFAAGIRYLVRQLRTLAREATAEATGAKWPLFLDRQATDTERTQP